MPIPRSVSPLVSLYCEFLYEEFITIIWSSNVLRSFREKSILIGKTRMVMISLLDNQFLLALVSRLSNMVENFESAYRIIEAYTLVAEFCQDYQLDAGAHERCRRRACSIAVLKSLVNEPNSGLVRVGFLEKMSSRGRGFQPRMALLLTDRLIYCGRVSGSSSMQLKVSLMFEHVYILSTYLFETPTLNLFFSTACWRL